ncbi:MAG: hypothetical protein IT290_12975 [Deltaproteobacteria bacterium]|nr:hypothetical protein [Deltaproteobacteria bacterium]
MSKLVLSVLFVFVFQLSSSAQRGAPNDAIVWTPTQKAAIDQIVSRQSELLRASVGADAELHRRMYTVSKSITLYPEQRTDPKLVDLNRQLGRSLTKNQMATIERYFCSSPAEVASSPSRSVLEAGLYIVCLAGDGRSGGAQIGNFIEDAWVAAGGKCSAPRR